MVVGVEVMVVVVEVMVVVEAPVEGRRRGNSAEPRTWTFKPLRKIH